MNSGLQDAFNLAWILALVYHGATDPTLLDSYEAERPPVAEMITQSGDVAEHMQTMTDPTERDSRNQAIKAMLADPKARHHEVVAETELNVDYVRSPIVSGDANGYLGPGERLPSTIQVQRPDEQPCRLHELARRAGHTVMLLGGPTAHGPALVELHTALQELTTDSPLFEAAIVLSTQPEPREQIGWLEPVGADLVGVQGTTLLVVRPDGYIGLRSDRDHLSALERYRKILHAGRP